MVDVTISSGPNKYIVEVDTSTPDKPSAVAYYGPENATRIPYNSKESGLSSADQGASVQANQDDSTRGASIQASRGDSTQDASIGSVQATQDSLSQRSVSIDTTQKNTVIEDQSISEHSGTELNKLIFETDKPDHVLLISQTGNRDIAVVDDINNINKIWSPNTTIQSNYIRSNYAQTIPIHVPSEEDSIIIEYGNLDLIIIEKNPGNYTYKYKVKTYNTTNTGYDRTTSVEDRKKIIMEKGTVVDSEFSFFELFPLTTSPSVPPSLNSSSRQSSTMSPLSESQGGQVKRRNRRRITRNRRRMRSRKTANRRSRS